MGRYELDKSVPRCEQLAGSFLACFYQGHCVSPSQTNIKPAAPKLNVALKTHKENQPIRPIINNRQAPTYKIARYINKRLQNLINLPNEYNAKNSIEIAKELTTLQINESMNMITLDIKDMYVNLPIEGIMLTTKFWLNKNSNNNKHLKQQTLNIIRTIIKQNYFQYDGQIYKPEKGIAMGSPISSRNIHSIF